MSSQQYCSYQIILADFSEWGVNGSYTLLFLLLLLPLIWRIPAYYVPKENTQSESTEDDKPFPLGSTIMVCLAMTLFFARDGALWGFAQEIGKRTGMGDEQIGAVLGMAGVLGLSGAFLVAFVNVRFGRALPMSLGLVAVTVLSLLLCFTDNPTVYSVGVSVWQAATFFVVPYIFGIAAALDPKGRVIAACGGCLLLGGAIGPGANWKGGKFYVDEYCSLPEKALRLVGLE